MNVIRTTPSPPDLLRQYACLPPVAKAILGLKSLTLLPGDPAIFLHCLRVAGVRAADGRPWSLRSLTAQLEELRRQGLLTAELTCPPALLHRASVDALAAGNGSSLVALIRDAFPVQRRGWPYDARPYFDAWMRLIRLAVYANDEAAFTAGRDTFDKECAPNRVVDFLASLFGSVPLAPDWLDRRKPAIHLALFEAKLCAFVRTGVPDPGLGPLIAQYRTQNGQERFAAVLPALLLHDLLAGRVTDARRELAAIEDTTLRPAFEGTVTFLEGANEAALQHFRSALKPLRKLAGKRRVFLDGVPGICFLLALLRAGDAALQAEIQAGLDAIIAERTPYADGFLAMQALLWLVQGLEAKAREQLDELREAMPAEPFSAACVALAQHAVDRTISGAFRTDLIARFEGLKGALPLVARIYAEILADVTRTPGPYRVWLAATGQGLGLTFTQIIQTRQPWERALDSLDAFLGSETPQSDTAKAPRKVKRLAWFINPETREIDAAEQSAKGREGWSDGRPVAMKRLHEQDPRLDYLTEQDRAALRTIRKVAAGWQGTDSYYFDPLRTIPALIGHPAVFDARRRTQALELVHYPLELIVSEQPDGYRAALSHSAEQAAVFLEAETPTRYRVVEFPKAMLAVQEILGPRGLTVPAGGRDKVLALVRRANPTLPIRADIAALGQPALEGHSAPVVQLMPYEAGLKISLLVRPFGPDGPGYVAGVGARSVLAGMGGQQLRASRDLARELGERNALVEGCPTLRQRAGTDAHDIVIDDLEGCLELLLELQGFGGPVSIEWPEGRKMQVSALAPDRLKLRVGQDRDWFSVEGTVALDEEQVLEMRFLLDRLDGAKGRFVPLGDGRFVALTRQLQAQLQRLAAVSEPHRSGRRVHALGAPALEAVLQEAGEVRADAAWQRQVARIRAAEGFAPKIPATLQAELRDYQVEGFVWLSRLARWGAGACLADDMGLGKTVQAIAVMLDRAAEGPCLVVAPTSVCPNWVAEITRFAPPLTVHRFAAGADRAAIVAGLGAQDVLVCSYGLLHQATELLAGRRWQMVVLDEAQAIKNAASKRAQASLALQAGFRLALTGTPVENYLDELWSLFNFVNPGLLGSREGFQKRFAVPIERDRDPTARQALRSLLRPFLLRRTKAAVLSELPPRTEQTINVEMSDAERVFYQALRQRALDSIAALDVAKGSRKIHILAEITRLRRACCNPALIDAEAGVPSGKLEAFLELVEELIRNRHRALVFSQFVGHLGLVRAALDGRGIRYEYLDGSTPSAERERRVAAFQSGGADLFLISLRAGGTGLNLTAADYVVHLDPWWNPAVEDQASDRAHRIGQERPVTIYRLIMQDSIEERILRLHRDKRDLASDLLEGAESTGRLSEEELLDLLRP